MPENVSVAYFLNEELFTSFAVPRTASFADIRQRWREASEDWSPVAFLRDSLDGAALPEDGSLEDILPPQKAVLNLHILHETEHSDEMRGRSTVQSGKAVGRAIVQSGEVVGRTIVQSQSGKDGRTVTTVGNVMPETRRIANFHIWFSSGSGSRHFFLDVTVGGALHGRQLRAAIAEAPQLTPFEVEADRLEVVQSRAKRKTDGAVVVNVDGDEAWADEQGEEVPEAELEAQEEHVILDDEMVGTAGHLRPWIYVSQISGGPVLRSKRKS